ncbi:thrombospondin type 3 repeat-containing protein [Porticoccaceae bacterium]|nr:thrombospondin type 3 repeat-containing protein [Porticoccaceae bacterium]
MRMVFSLTSKVTNNLKDLLPNILLLAFIAFFSSNSLAYDSDGDGIEDDIDTVMEADGNILILSDTQWSAGEIELNSDVQIDEGVTLTLPSGTVLNGNGQQITIYGSLNIEGVEKNTKIKELKIYLSDQSSRLGYLNISDVEMETIWFGLSNYGSFDIADSLLKDIRNFYVYYPRKSSSILRNIFQNFEPLRTLTSSGGELVVRNNVFLGVSIDQTRCTISNTASYGDSLTVEFNSFLRTDYCALKASGQGSPMSGVNNYFGTTDESEIESRILDRNDDLNYAYVIEYVPFLTEPHPDTPTLFDTDDDGLLDFEDNCPTHPNPDQIDTDLDDIGDVCDSDDDNDGVLDADDSSPLDPTNDSDGDGVANNSDAFPLDSTETTDTDGDGVGDNGDAFSSDPTETVDTDGDGVGNNMDGDDDNDGVIDADDASPLDPFNDSDGDGLANNADAFPLDNTETTDTDGDGVGNNTDVDDDGDGVIDTDDPYPLDSTRQSQKLLDIDGNDKVDALTDGLVILRYVFGLRGDVLIGGVVADDATRKTAEEIEAYLATLMPSL